MRFFRIPFQPDDEAGSLQRKQRLHRYFQAQSAEDISRLASEISPEIKQLVAANVQALLGYLPAQDFNTTVSTSKENLQNLLASAMLTGYFMHAMEQRLDLETLLDPELDAPSSSEQSAAEGAALETSVAEMRINFGEAPETRAEPAADFEEQTADLLRDPRELFGTPDKLDIQLEINTRMDHAELVRLLRALKQFQHDDDQPADDQDE